MPICKGIISKTGKPCENEALENNTCCKKHVHMQHYTDDMITKSSKCGRCFKYFEKETSYCDGCLEKSKKIKKNLKINNNTICKGIAQNGDACGKKVVNETEFCKNHEYMKDYTDEMLEDLEKCSGCKNRYHGLNGSRCIKCKSRTKDKKVKYDSESEDKSNDSKNLNKCKADKCSSKKYGDTDYCKVHKKYIIDDPNIKLGETHKRCSNFERRGCKTFMSIAETRLMCDNCRAEDKIKSQKRKDKKNNDNEEEEKNKPKVDNSLKDIMDELNEFDDIDVNCNNKKNKNIIKSSKNKIIENDDEGDKNSNNKSNDKKSSDKKINKLTDKEMTDEIESIFSIVNEKLQGDGDDDDIENSIFQEYVSQIKDYDEFIRRIKYVEKDGKLNKEGGFKTCKGDHCKGLGILLKYKNYKVGCKILPMCCFNESEEVRSNCIFCREKSRKKDKVRRTNENRIKWKEDNYDKQIIAWRKSRGKRIEENGEEYRRKNAENAKKNRRENPEKQKEINEKKRCDENNSYKSNMASARTKGIQVEITKERYLEIGRQKCYYCGKTDADDRGFNGVDRLNNSIGYKEGNCVSSCIMCNLMKKDLILKIFLKRIEHILVNMNMVVGKLYPHSFEDTKSIRYSQYIYRLKKENSKYLEMLKDNKNMDEHDVNTIKNKIKENKNKYTVELTEDEFYKITSKKCYICGKKPNQVHKNGLDRFESNKNYCKENVKSCCTNCNMLKKEYSMIDFTNKMMQIYKNRIIKMKDCLDESDDSDNDSNDNLNDNSNDDSDNNSNDELDNNFNNSDNFNNNSNTKIKKNKIKMTDDEKCIYEKERKQKYREKIRNKEGIQKRVKRTSDEIKEQGRLRQQAKRERDKIKREETVDKYTDKEKNDKICKEILEKRKLRKDNEKKDK